MLVARQLPHCRPHVLGARLAVDLLETSFTPTLDVLSDAFYECSCLLDPTSSHQSVLASQFGFNFWGDEIWISVGHCNGSFRIILVEKLD